MLIKRGDPNESKILRIVKGEELDDEKTEEALEEAKQDAKNISSKLA